MSGGRADMQPSETTTDDRTEREQLIEAIMFSIDGPLLYEITDGPDKGKVGYSEDAYLSLVDGTARYVAETAYSVLAAEVVSLRGKLAKVRELAEDGINAQSFSLRQCWAEFVAINVAAGAPDPRCGATDGVHVCTQIAGHHSPDDYHDDGSFAFFVTGSEVPA